MRRMAAALRLLPQALEASAVLPASAAGASSSSAGAAAAACSQLLHPPQPLVSLWDCRRPRPFSVTGAAAQSSSSRAAADAALPEVYARVEARVTGAYVVPPKAVFAVVEVGGTQYKVTPDDVIVTEKLVGVDVNDRLELRRVLMLGSAAETVIGRPYVPGAVVTAAVEEQFLDGKVIIFHKRRRKNSRRLKGHRQPLTTLRILDVVGIDPVDAPGGQAAA